MNTTFLKLVSCADLDKNTARRGLFCGQFPQRFVQVSGVSKFASTATLSDAITSGEISLFDRLYNNDLPFAEEFEQGSISATKVQEQFMSLLSS